MSNPADPPDNTPEEDLETETKAQDTAEAAEPSDQKSEQKKEPSEKKPEQKKEEKELPTALAYIFGVIGLLIMIPVFRFILKTVIGIAKGAVIFHGTICIAIIVIWAFIIYLFRPLYIKKKYGRTDGIPISCEMTQYELLSFLRTELFCPIVKEIYTDEDGVVCISCKSGVHRVWMNNQHIYVSKDSNKRLIRNARFIEEAECLKAYLRKALNPSERVNPRRSRRYLTFFRVGTKLTSLIVFLLCVGLIAVVILRNPSIASKDISTSYLSEYSTTTTIGNAFDGYFDEGRWTNFTQNGAQYVDYTGTYTYNDVQAQMLIRFQHFGDEFRIDSILINGVALDDWEEVATLLVIYGLDGDASAQTENDPAIIQSTLAVEATPTPKPPTPTPASTETPIPAQTQQTMKAPGYSIAGEWIDMENPDGNFHYIMDLDSSDGIYYTGEVCLTIGYQAQFWSFSAVYDSESDMFVYQDGMEWFEEYSDTDEEGKMQTETTYDDGLTTGSLYYEGGILYWYDEANDTVMFEQG